MAFRHGPWSVRDVVLLTSSSRSGSSLFAHMLLQTRKLVMLQGECNPYFRMVGLNGNGPLAPMSVATANDAALGLGDMLLENLGFLLDKPDQEYAYWVHQQLRLQWPWINFSWNDVRGWVWETLHNGGSFADFLHLVHKRHPSVNLHRYDLPSPDLIGVKAPSSSPRAVLEEPPFICFAPWRQAYPEDIANKTLLFKGPAEAYRIDFWRRVFPNATIRVLHLVRNPAAAINGMWDGWRSVNFHSHLLPEGTLDIKGYTSPGRRGSDRWWKFDQPSDWAAYTNAPLEQICAYQWREAHRAILDQEVDNYHQLRFEDLMDPWKRPRVLADAFDWLGIEYHWDPERPLPLVMATTAPGPARWRAREGIIEPVLASVQDIASELGYTEREAWV